MLLASTARRRAEGCTIIGASSWAVPTKIVSKNVVLLLEDRISAPVVLLVLVPIMFLVCSLESADLVELVCIKLLVLYGCTTERVLWKSSTAAQ